LHTFFVTAISTLPISASQDAEKECKHKRFDMCRLRQDWQDHFDFRANPTQTKLQGSVIVPEKWSDVNVICSEATGRCLSRYHQQHLWRKVAAVLGAKEVAQYEVARRRLHAAYKFLENSVLPYVQLQTNLGVYEIVLYTGARYRGLHTGTGTPVRK
jgi:hypothetical protein